MKIKVILHDAEEGGYWASVPSLPGCFSQGDTFEETLVNIREAIECYFDASDLAAPESGQVEEVEV
jgi:predicted RNase H-like HicB family nuclease